MNELFRFQALAGAAVVAVAALFVVVVLPGIYPPSGGFGATSPSPSASPTASPIAFSTFVSTRHGYAIRYPRDWSVAPATEPLPYGTWVAGGPISDAAYDVFSPPLGPLQSHVGAFSQLLPAGVSEGAWRDAYLAGFSPPIVREECVPPFGEWSHLTVDGVDVAWYNGLVVSAAKSAACHWADAIAFSGGRAYEFTLVSADATSIAIFEQMLPTITFRPQDADDAPVTPSPSP